MKSKVLGIFLLLFFAASIGKAWHWARDGFNIQRVRTPLPEAASYIEPSSTIISALQQPYHYIGRGRQCYAFASLDNRFVLKLPRMDRYKYGIPLWLDCLPFLGGREKARADALARLALALNSFQIAADELARETAILYLHLHKTRCFAEAVVTVVDCLGRPARLALDTTPFVLQEKKELMMPAFKKALQAGDRRRAKAILEAFLTVVASRSQKGISNNDASFLRNFGIDGDQGVMIDIGNFYRKEGPNTPEAKALSFRETAIHTREWLARLDPEMESWFAQRVDEIVAGF